VTIQTILQRLFGSRRGNILLAIAIAGLVMSGVGFHADQAHVAARLATVGYIANGINEFHRRRSQVRRRPREH
jgi:hypothetical protein